MNPFGHSGFAASAALNCITQKNLSRLLKIKLSKNKKPLKINLQGLYILSGSVLLSHTVYHAVPSAI
jgi:hypothetical protein